MPDPEQQQDRIPMWDTASGECVRVFGPRPTRASRLELSHDGRFAVSGGVEPAVHVWDVTTGRCLRTLDGHHRLTAGLSITPDANYVFTSDADQTLRLWELDWELRPTRER